MVYVSIFHLLSCRNNSKYTSSYQTQYALSIARGEMRPWMAWRAPKKHANYAKTKDAKRFCWYVNGFSSSPRLLTSAHKFIIVESSRVGGAAAHNNTHFKSLNYSRRRQSQRSRYLWCYGEITFRDEIICNHKIYVPFGMIEVVERKPFHASMLNLHEFLHSLWCIVRVGARNWLGF